VNFSYWSGDDFYPVVRIESGIYYTRDHVTRNSFDVPLLFTPGFKVSENLYLILGCSVEAFSNSIVFPIGGFNWKISNKFNFRAVFPQPRFSYRPNDRLEIYLGGELIGAGYRKARQVIAGPIMRSSRKGIEFEAIAGWTFERTYDYVRSGPDYYSKVHPILEWS